MKLWPLLFLALLVIAGPLQAQSQAPTGLTATPSGEGTAVDLSWDSVSGAVGYEVLEWRGGEWRLNDRDPNRIPLTATTTLADLNNGLTYKFAVRALFEGGLSSPISAPVEFVAKREVKVFRKPAEDSPQSGTDRRDRVSNIDPKAPPPEAPTGLFALFSSQTVVKLSWRKVRGAARYYVEEEKDGAWVPCQEADSSEGSNVADIKNHPTPGPYRFRVRAVGRNGKSSPPSFPCTARR